MMLIFCDNSIVLFVGKVRVFFFLYIYTYLIDLFYLLVVNCCCCLVCPALRGCGAHRLHVHALAHLPPRAWEDGGWQRPRSQKPFCFLLFRYCASCLERGKVGF